MLSDQHCPACRQINPADMQYCLNCGVRLSEPISDATIAMNPREPVPRTISVPDQPSPTPVRRSGRGLLIAAGVLGLGLIVIVVIAGAAVFFIWNASRKASVDSPPTNTNKESIAATNSSNGNTSPAWGLPDTIKDFVLSKHLDDMARQTFPDTTESRGYLYQDSKSNATIEFYISKYTSVGEAKARYARVPETLELGSPIAKQAIEGGKGELGYYRKASKTGSLIIALAYSAADAGAAVEIIIAPSEKECLKFAESVSSWGSFVDKASPSKN